MIQEYDDLYELSNNDIIVELGRRFRDYRVALRLTQKQVSEQCGVSVMTIVRFENGTGGSVRLDNFTAMMRVIQKLDAVAYAVPEMPQSLYSTKVVRKASRVRKGKNG